MNAVARRRAPVEEDHATAYVLALAAALDHSWCCITLVDDQAFVLHRNGHCRDAGAARQIHGDGTGRLALHSVADSARLRKEVAGVAHAAAMTGEVRWTGFVPRQHEEDVVVLLAGVPSTSKGGPVPRKGQHATVLVFTFQPSRVAISEELVRKVFGLTESQSRVAGLVARGLGPRDVAKALGRDYETARSHIRELRSRTGVRTRAELVRMLMLIGNVAGSLVGASPSELLARESPRRVG